MLLFSNAKLIGAENICSFRKRNNEQSTRLKNEKEENCCFGR
jgi:hypothetical protein